MFDNAGGLPLHPLVIHATVMLIVASCLGATALAVIPQLRHRYGYLLLWVEAAAVVVTWIAIESGEYLTALPGLGSAAHANGGVLLFKMLIPFVILSIVMVLLDRWLFIDKNKHGTTYRPGKNDRAKQAKDWKSNRIGKPPPAVFQVNLLGFVCILTAVSALLIVSQTMLVGHSGAEATWVDVVK